MAEVPPGPSSLLPPPAPPASAVAEPRCPFPAGAALVCCSEDEAATTTATPDGGPRATATKGSGVHSGESPPHCLPSNARTALPSPAEAAAARNGLAEGAEQEEEEDEQAMVGEECVGAIVCKLDMHKKMFRRGYIAMLAVDSKYRRNGIGTNLVKKAIYAMVEGDCDEVVLETEITNKSALKLYENLGFVRDKRLFRYYLNGVDALRLKLWLR
ncbi:N-alpha-acetyltransferase 30, NatC catalytic subunit [Phyllostomus discolor]|uniref:N-alpha-acetyltransferase 30, NatC catalytic subunit n=1 Tax=Phyllostomus discolor TaxID=89673 RepID=A0A834BJ38_9CHIR|nr:N-alpha-acetyltransferase 30, NatC catalytic subunit [Phyllostomus discolor]